MLNIIFCALLPLLMLGNDTVLAAAQKDITVYLGGTIIDGTCAATLTNASVLVEGERIVAVGIGSDVAIPAGARVVDVHGKWIVPGLIDAHIHFFQSGGLYTRPDVIDLRRIRPYREEIAWIRARIPQTLARYLASGVTTVVDVDGPFWTYEVRAFARQNTHAPRVFVSGPGLAPMNPGPLMSEDPPGIEVNTPESARETVRSLIKRKPDLLKIWFPLLPDMNLEKEMGWVRAAIDEAHAHGVRVGVHATQRELARTMIHAGADILVHSVDDEPLDAEFIRNLKDRDVIYVTTIMVNEGYQEVLGQNVQLTDIESSIGDPEVVATFDHFSRIYPWLAPRTPPPTKKVVLENLKTVHDSGVTVAAGSDAGNIGTLHGPSLHRELELMVQAGLTPFQVLVAATQGGARVAGKQAELGAIQPGMLADLVILDANPLDDIRNLRQIHRVVKGGVMFDPDAILKGLKGL